MYASPDIADCRLPIADCRLGFCEEELYQVRTPGGRISRKLLFANWQSAIGNCQSDNRQYGTVPLSMKTLLRSLSIHFYLTVCLLAGFTVVAGQERSLGSITYRLSMSRP